MGGGSCPAVVSVASNRLRGTGSPLDAEDQITGVSPGSRKTETLERVRWERGPR